VSTTSLITTRFTQPIKTIADIEALERQPYESLIPARNLHDLFAATARLHPDRPALTVLTKGSREPGDVTLTHRQLLAEISRAANLFRSHGIDGTSGTVAFSARSCRRCSRPCSAPRSQVSPARSTIC
jgi:fatty-acyl-CoA synthase